MAERHLRPVGKDCLVAFGGNLYSVPARKVRPRQLVEIRATKSQVMLHTTVPDASGETLLSSHPRAVGRGVVVKQDEHWDGLPTGKEPPHHDGRRAATTAERVLRVRSHRAVAGPVEPGRCNPDRGREAAAVGL